MRDAFVWFCYVLWPGGESVSASNDWEEPVLKPKAEEKPVEKPETQAVF